MHFLKHANVQQQMIFFGKDEDMYFLKVPKDISKNALFGQKNEERASKNGTEHVSILVFPQGN
jgi:hypothetical protein